SNRVESSPDTEHRIHVGFGEDQWQIVPLVQSDAMLTGNAATCPYTSLHEFASGFLDTPDLIFRARVKTDKRMQVAVARMKHVCQYQSVLVRDAIAVAHHFRQS